MPEIDYKKEYELLHVSGHCNGYSVLRHKIEILKIINSTKSNTLLDCGSGKGMQYSEFKLDETLSIIFSKTTKFVFFCVYIDAAKKKFSNGINVHVTIKSKEFWTEIINKHNKNNIKVELIFATKQNSL